GSVMVKPQAGLFWIGCAFRVGCGVWRARAIRALVVWCVAGLAVPVLVLGWLAWRGGAGPFAAILAGYVLPLYSRVGRVGMWEGLRWHVLGWQILSCLLALALLGFARKLSEPYGIRRWLTILGLVYGLAHYAIQGKGWEHHLYPFGLFACALASIPLAALSGPPATTRWRMPRLPHGLALGLVVLTVALLGVKGVDAADAPWIADKERR